MSTVLSILLWYGIGAFAALIGFAIFPRNPLYGIGTGLGLGLFIWAVTFAVIVLV